MKPPNKPVKQMHTEIAEVTIFASLANACFCIVFKKMIL